MRIKNTLKEVKDLLTKTTYLKTCKVFGSKKDSDYYTIVENNEYFFKVTLSKNTGVLNVRTDEEQFGRITYYQMQELVELDKQLKEIRYQKAGFTL